MQMKAKILNIHLPQLFTILKEGVMITKLF